MATYSIKEAKPAPSSSKGIVFWLKENMFSAYEIGKWKPDPALFLNAAKTMAENRAEKAKTDA